MFFPPQEEQERVGKMKREGEFGSGAGDVQLHYSYERRGEMNEPCRRREIKKDKEER